MSIRAFRSSSAAFALVVLTSSAWAAAPIRPASGGDRNAPTATATTPTRKASTPRTTSAPRGTLPDPALLDGSSHPAEKRPEYGMVGDFELPGDENARNGRVGGPQNQNQQQQEQEGQGGQGGGTAAGMPPMAGGGQGQQSPAVPPPPTIQPGGGGPEGPENPGAAGKQVSGAGDQNGQPRGQQVAELQGQGGGPEQGTIGEKPQQVSIGDSAMQIQTVANAPSVVGQQQQSGKSQQHEKTTGTGGKAPAGSNSNRGAERGQVMPAGL